jgi:hypothetical protein
VDLLFFTPHAALWAHTLPEAYLARALFECGHNVRYLTCGRAQTYCAAMTARRLEPGCTPEQSRRICAECTSAAGAIARRYDFRVDTLSRYLKEDDLAAFDRIVAKAVSEKSLDTEYLGIQVGRAALYEFTLAHKKTSTNLTEPQWNDYKVYLINALRTLHGFSVYFDRNRPDAIFNFSPQYSNNHTCMQYAINQGVRVLFLENGTNLAHRLGTMRVWDWGVHRLVNPALSYWGSRDLNPVTVSSAEKVTRHFEILLKGLHFAVFSAPHGGVFDLRERWNVGSAKKVLLMTLSSYDEAYAAYLIGGFPSAKVFSDVFRTQADWIKATLSWVAARPDLFLIIRVHPRDFPNKREHVRSEQSYMLENLLKNVPENVHVNWPSEGVSLYDLLEDTDVLITGWSVTALEALVLGTPVVTYDANLPSYPCDIHYSGRTESDYFANIDRALNDGWRIENVINAFRWLAFNFVTCTVTVSESFGKFETSSLHKFWWRVRSRLPVLRHSPDLRKWRGALPGARIVSAMLEKGYDALPPVNRAVSEAAMKSDDYSVILNSLSRLHGMLYASKKLAQDKRGLSRYIREFLARENRR